MARPRPISIGVPTGTLKMTLWAGTEDEESFPIVGLYHGTPHVTAYGRIYWLTNEEVEIAKQLIDSIHGWRG